MKFKVDLSDVINNNYCVVAERLFDSGGVRMVIETNKIRLEYQGCEVTKQFDFPESSSSIEEKIEAMCMFLDTIIEGLSELMKYHEQIENIFNEKINHRVEVIDEYLSELFKNKYGEERYDD